MNLPNLISLARIFLVPVVVWLIIDGETQMAFILFFLAGLSDAADGYLAKQFGWQTELGAYLDPIADKALLVSIFVVLGLSGAIPASLVIAVVSRDILIIGALLLSWMLGRPMPVRPLVVSKVNTGCQIALAALVLANLGFGLGLMRTEHTLVWVVGILTITSAAAYLLEWLRHMTAGEAPAHQAAFNADEPGKTVSSGERAGG